MLYTYILDDNIKCPTLILTLITQLSYFSHAFFYKIKNFFFFCGWTSSWTRTYICMTLPLLTAHFSWLLPFLQSQKVVTLPLFPPPPLPLLISDKSLNEIFLHDNGTDLCSLGKVTNGTLFGFMRDAHQREIKEFETRTRKKTNWHGKSVRYKRRNQIVAKNVIVIRCSLIVGKAYYSKKSNYKAI